MAERAVRCRERTRARVRLGRQAAVAVRVLSGDVLHIGFERTGPFQFEHVTLGGPADFVFSGEIAV